MSNQNSTKKSPISSTKSEVDTDQGIELNSQSDIQPEFSAKSSKKSLNSFQKALITLKIDIKHNLITFREVLMGRSKHQLQGEKHSYLGKKMFGILFIFIIYAFVLFARMNSNVEDGSIFDIFLNILCLGQDPYLIGIAVTMTFFTFSFLICNEKILVWMFGRLYFLKQLIFFVTCMILSYVGAYYLDQSQFDYYSFLLLLAMVWLIFQSIRIYSAARKGATKLEMKFSENYSPFLYFLAIIIPFLILGIITFISWVFRYYTVIFTLDFLGKYEPLDTFPIYVKEMNEIFPMLYTGLFLIFIFMVLQISLSRKKGATRRAGTFDNLTFGLVALVMFLYAVYNIALYLYLDPALLSTLGKSLGNEDHSGLGIFFIIEFLIAMLFLLWIVLDLQKQFKNGFLFFTKDGFIFFLMGTILAQTSARLGLITKKTGEITVLAKYIQYDYVILPWIILGFLGLTILAYWIKPQQFSMFMHINDAAIRKEDKSMEVILAFLKRDFIRRGEKFEINSDILNSLRKITGLSKGIIMSLIYRLDKQLLDVQVTDVVKENGEKLVYFDFIPITQRYQKSKEADERAKKFLATQFHSSLTRDQRKKLNLTKQKTSSSNQNDTFIQALSVQYGRKIKDEEIIKKTQEEQEFIIERAIDEDTKYLVYELLKQEYIKRIKLVADYPNDFRFRISEIAQSIEQATKVPIGRVFPLVQQIAVEDWNLNVNAKIDDKNRIDDKQVEFLPIDDFDVYYALEEYRPEQLEEVKRLMQTWFDRNINYRGNRLEKLLKVKVYTEDEEFQRSYLSKWFENLLIYFNHHYTNMEKERKTLNESRRMQYTIKKIISSKQKLGFDDTYGKF